MRGRGRRDRGGRTDDGDSSGGPDGMVGPDHANACPGARMQGREGALSGKAVISLSVTPYYIPYLSLHLGPGFMMQPHGQWLLDISEHSPALRRP